ncbi:universal stress protein [Streptomyces sp. JJ38]|uniref:universal stress protein n=1 Tax=Streptomyces sp. JJ38 TaxID=2738128 RepID=UPI0027E2114D|nr:universal stress protein [Streptomyces sp. JJ38]
MNRPVVVGVDGSPSSLEAVAVAAREARLRRCPLEVVHAFVWLALRVPPRPPALGPAEDELLGPVEGGLRDQAERAVALAVERARAEEPEVAVTGAVVPGETVPVLEDRSRDAVLLVVGSRGRGGFTGLVLGSTAVHLAAHGHCPLLVVRGTRDDTRPVLLGVDGSPAGAAAADFAFAEAALRGTGVLALHAWTPWNVKAPRPEDPAAPYALEQGELAAGEERVLAEALAGRTERHPEVPVEHEVLRGGTREALIERSERAGLVVVGARGHGGFTGLLLGSVSQAVLHHAHCPVAVVRGHDARH